MIKMMAKNVQNAAHMLLLFGLSIRRRRHHFAAVLPLMITAIHLHPPRCVKCPWDKTPHSASAHQLVDEKQGPCPGFA